tara:strand:- start:4424 stop:5908 length:1485 start_codon:yes stop_codon:yes gene_type:complete
MSEFIISIDQGTTSSRAVLFSNNGHFLSLAQTDLPQIFPAQGLVEHDPAVILSTTMDVLQQILSLDIVKGGKVIAMGITNQRETAIVWDKETGEPIYNAIVWQDMRTSDVCKDLKSAGFSEYVKSCTGLMIDPYFSGTKIAWILDNVDGARERAERGELCFGTVDSWLLYNLTGRKVHATDVTNASRTLLFNLRTLKWDERMLETLRVPEQLLPEVFPSSNVFGHFDSPSHGPIPITAILGDQQSALFGQCCFSPGMAKNTYGTGCFMLMNTGVEIPNSDSGLLNTIAWQIGDKITYALEGSVFVAGAAIQWLRDGLEIIDHARETSEIAARDALKNPDSSVVMVPAFAGLGTPFWDMQARGAILGLTRDSGRDSIIRATLESLAHRSNDVLDVMQEDSGISLFALKVDGGASANDYLMQFQSNLLGVSIERLSFVESTASGVAYMAALTIGALTLEEISLLPKLDRSFDSEQSVEWRERKKTIWSKALERVVL